MAERKQVMDIHANSSGITQAESNEQQRNWNDKMWSVKASDSLSNYDFVAKRFGEDNIVGFYVHLDEIKLKGISTMIANLHTRKEEVQEQIDLIARQFGQDGVDNADLAMQMSKLRKELDGIDEKLALRQKMLDDANATITEAKHRLAEMKYEHSRMQEVLGEDMDLHSIQLQRNMLATFNSMLVSSLEPLTSTFTDRQQEILNESGYSDLMRNSNSIINCAMLLSLGYIREATTYAESCGGGGSLGSGWGRDKDEDDDHWWRRCIAVSAAMMRPVKYRMRRGC